MKTKKRTKKSKKKGGRRRQKRIPLLIPKTRIVRLRAVTKQVLTVTGTDYQSAYTLYMTANDLNDPFLTAGSRLPLGTDQWGALYQTYRVLWSKCTVRYAYEDIDFPMLAALAPVRAASTSALDALWKVPSETYQQIDQFREYTGTKIHLLSQGNEKGVLTRTTKPQRWYSRNQRSEMQGTFSSTPGAIGSSDKIYWVFFMQYPDKSAVGTFNLGEQVDCLVELEYLVKLTEPVNLSSSII